MYDMKALYQAESVQDAVALRVAHPDAQIIAGGSDVLVQMREGKRAGVELISIYGLDELRGVTLEADGTLRIGSLTSFSHITRDPLIQKYLHVLGEAVDQVGGPQIRNIGTIGGNTCNGVTSADSASTLHAYDAIVELTGPDGIRRQPIREFYIRSGKVDIRPGEIQTAILIEKDSYIDTFGHYIKYAMRNAMDIATLGTSVNVRLSADKKTVERARVAFGVAGPVPLRAAAAEELAAGQPVSLELADRFAQAVKEDINPRDSWRAAKDFRMHIAVESARRAFIEAVKLAGGDGKACDAVSDCSLQSERQGRGTHGGRAGQPDGHAPQRLPDDLREEGLRGGGVRRLQRPDRRGGIQLLHLSGRVGGGQAHPHPGRAAGPQRRAQRHPAGLCGRGGHPVRLLHAGLYPDGSGDPGERQGVHGR